MMRITINRSGLTTLSSLKSVSSYTASEISGAEKFSPALSHYAGFKFSPEHSRYESRTSTWMSASVATILDTADAKAVCDQWSQFANQLLREVFNECFGTSTVALFALGKLGS